MATAAKTKPPNLPKWRPDYTDKSSGKTKPGFWYVWQHGKQVALGVKVPGNKGRKLAAEALAKLLAESPKTVEVAEPDLRYLCNYMLDRLTKDGRSETHIKSVRCHLREFCEGTSTKWEMVGGKYELVTRKVHKGYGNLLPSEFSELQLDAWVDAHPKWKDATKRRAIVTVLSVFNKAVEKKLISENPIKHYELPEGDTKEALFTEDEISRILNNRKTPRQFRLFFEALLDLGCRCGELAKATAENIHVSPTGRLMIVFDKKSWKAGKKTKQQRVIPLTARWEQYVQEQLAGAAPKSSGKTLWRCSKTHGMWTNFTWGKFFAVLRVRLKLNRELTMYSTRHYWITKALLAGVPIAHVARVAGTSVKVIEERYSHLGKVLDLHAIADKVAPSKPR